uniref:Ig-like domain-containing protein n=1 Tax=Poecilia reticulata TaxID=8081 RepID=A0A3P9PFI9_POERE
MSQQVALLCRAHLHDERLHEVISAEPGQTVTLPCKAAESELVTAVEWTRAAQETEDVLLYIRGEGEDPANQNPSYKNRVSLKDEQMKDGDMSLVLKNVKPNDNGTYECRLQKQAFGLEPVCSVQLVVRPGEVLVGSEMFFSH